MTAIQRCTWAHNASPQELAYHDDEWGVPLHDDRHLFEMLTLEGAQSGLRWSTILARREGYRRAFQGFDATAVARWPAERVDELLADSGVIRHRGKLESTLNNARAIMELAPEFSSLSSYLWSFTDGQPIQPRFEAMRDVPAHTEISHRLSKDMKRRGFRFVGPTTMYALMQAVGMTNDHIVTCFRHGPLDPGTP